MERDKLIQQAQEVISAQPGLCLEEHGSDITLVGRYVLDGIYENIPFYDEFDLEIKVPWEYPLIIPEVKERGKRITSSGYTHVFDTDNLCLGATCDLIDRIQSSSSLLDYLDSVIPSYLYGFLYFEKYGTVAPYGERSHRGVGLEEAYKERYGVFDSIRLYQLLGILGGATRYRGHIPCPCGSGKKLRNCHGPALLRDRESDYFLYFRGDAAGIIHEANERMMKQREAKGRLRTAIQNSNKF